MSKKDTGLSNVINETYLSNGCIINTNSFKRNNSANKSVVVRQHRNRSIIYRSFLLLLLCCCFFDLVKAQEKSSHFKVIAFFTAKEDLAHISFVHEANKWFSSIAAKYQFTYDSTNNWNNMNANFLSNYQVVLFLDTRPEIPEQRNTFKKYMEAGGAWMGFHFSAFALTPSAYPQDWDWYHNEFLGAGEYKGNTWRPTSSRLHVEDRTHPAAKHLPATFLSAPNEWYSWNNDLRLNKNIKILLSIDSSGFPVGTGPKLYEIWHSGYYPVVWTNTNYKMIYLNMGHNDMDYENKTNKQLSSTFSSEAQNQLIIDGLLWLGDQKDKSSFKHK